MFHLFIECIIYLNPESRELEEHFFEIPPELCQLKIIAFSKEMGSSVSLLPSIMHRLENFLVAIELKRMLSASFPEGAEVTAQRVRHCHLFSNCSRIICAGCLHINN